MRRLVCAFVVRKHRGQVFSDAQAGLCLCYSQISKTGFLASRSNYKQVYFIQWVNSFGWSLYIPDLLSNRFPNISVKVPCNPQRPAKMVEAKIGMNFTDVHMNGNGYKKGTQVNLKLDLKQEKKKESCDTLGK